MILFPAIDLVDGKVVRLERGDRSKMKVYSENPAAVARYFVEQGATWVHVVDLSSAFEEDGEARAANDAAIKAICEVDGISVDVGGGVRSLARVDELRALGAKRISLGTVLVREPSFAEVVAKGFGECIVADVAAKDGQVKVNGWREGISRSVEDVVGHLSELGFKHLVYTDIARDGMQTGVDALLRGVVLHGGGFAGCVHVAHVAERGDHAYQARHSVSGRQERARRERRQLRGSARRGRPRGAGGRL